MNLNVRVKYQFTDKRIQVEARHDGKQMNLEWIGQKYVPKKKKQQRIFVAEYLTNVIKPLMQKVANEMNGSVIYFDTHTNTKLIFDPDPTEVAKINN